MIDLCELGERPPLGEVPKRMHAYVVRQNRFGQPRDAWKREVIPTPAIGPDEVLVYVMASGINYNNVWAALGVPVDVIRVHAQIGDDSGFHIGGSDASGIVYAVGESVTNIKVGDRVVIHCGIWDGDDPYIRAGGDPIVAPSAVPSAGAFRRAKRHCGCAAGGGQRVGGTTVHGYRGRVQSARRPPSGE